MSGSPFTVWIYPTLGDPITVSTTDFDSEEAVIEAVTECFACGTPFQIREYEDDGAPGGTTLTVNPANVVAIRVRAPEPAARSTGQYL